jgi:hypothetical protein
MTFTVDAVAGAPVAGGTVRASVAYWGVKVYSQQTALCDAVSSCPIPPGPVRVSANQSIPAAAPRGNYVITLDVVDTAGAPLMCVSLRVRVESPAPQDKRPAAVGPAAKRPQAERAVIRAAPMEEDVEAIAVESEPAAGALPPQ